MWYNINPFATDYYLDITGVKILQYILVNLKLILQIYKKILKKYFFVTSSAYANRHPDQIYE